MSLSPDNEALVMRLIASNESLAVSVCQLANSVAMLAMAMEGEGVDEDEETEQTGHGGLDS